MIFFWKQQKQALHGSDIVFKFFLMTQNYQRMKKLILSFLLIFLIASAGFAQNTSKKKKSDKPVNYPWDSELLIDNQTTLSPQAKTLECIIQHRFGLVNQKGISDLFGIYAPGANIRLGLNYTPVKNLTIGYGLTKKICTTTFRQNG